MANCTFFGYRDCLETIKLSLREALVDLITNHDVDMFYVGHQGQFDAYVHSDLKKIKQEYPQINYAVVLAYMPGKKTDTTTAPGGNRGCPHTLRHLLAQQLDASGKQIMCYLHHPHLGRLRTIRKKS